jgi:hypothetical protein
MNSATAANQAYASVVPMGVIPHSKRIRQAFADFIRKYIADEDPDERIMRVRSAREAARQARSFSFHPGQSASVARPLSENR